MSEEGDRLRAQGRFDTIDAVRARANAAEAKQFAMDPKEYGRMQGLVFKHLMATDDGFACKRPALSEAEVADFQRIFRTANDPKALSDHFSAQYLSMRATLLAGETTPGSVTYCPADAPNRLPPDPRPDNAHKR